MISTMAEAKETLLEEQEYMEGLSESDRDDYLHELADGLVDVYTSNLWKWASENYRYVEEAIREMGIPETDGNPDLTKAIMLGQYLVIKRLLREGLFELQEELKEEQV